MWDGAYTGLRYWAHEHGCTAAARTGSPTSSSSSATSCRCSCSASSAPSGPSAAATRSARATAVAAILSLAIYSYAGERFAWLLVTTLLPLALLAGLGFAALWRSRRWVAVAVSAPLAAMLVWSDVQVQVLRPNDPRELMTSSPTDAGVPRLAGQLRRRDAQARAAGRPRPTIEVDPNFGSASPWSWYLRGLLAGYPDMAADTFAPRGDVLIMTEGSRAILGARLRGYEGRPFVLRFRRPPMGSGFTAGGLVRWFVHREPWYTVTPEREWIYERRAP